MEVISQSSHSSISVHSAAKDRSYLPPYRSLLTPHLKYDYQLHKNIELTSDEIQKYSRHHDKLRPALSTASSTNASTGSSGTHDTKKSTKIKVRYRSLLTDTKKKFFNKSSDLFSINSATTTKSSVGVPIPRLTFQALPVEVIQLILWFVRDDQRTLVNCLYVSKNFNTAVKKSLYYKPFFTSTYRVGQFVTSLQENAHLGKLVRVLDLSKLAPGIEPSAKQSGEDSNELLDTSLQSIINTESENIEDLMKSTTNDQDYGEFELRACWRDWKYRDNPLYGPSPVVLRSPLLTKQLTNSTLISNSSSVTSKFRSTNRSRSNSDATLVKPAQDFYELYRTHIDGKLFSSSSSISSSIASDETKRSLRLQKMKNFFKKTQLQAALKVESESEIAQKENDILDDNLTDTGAITRKPYYEPFVDPHPLANKYLYKYSVTKDLPCGYIIHLIMTCTNLIELNLSNLSLSLDFRIVPNDFKLRTRQLNYDETFERTVNPYYIQSLIPSIRESDEDELALLAISDAFEPHYKTKYLKEMSRLELSQNLIFLSDIGTANVDYHLSKRKLHKSVRLTTVDIIESLSSLPNIQKLNMNNCVWWDKSAVFKFLSLYHHDWKHVHFDFVNSGMNRTSHWAIEGSMRELIRAYKSEERYQKNWESMNQLIHRIGETY